MDWSYVAGLFDGEGSVSFIASKPPLRNAYTLNLRMSISASYESTRLALQEFLEENGIGSFTFASNNPFGISIRVTVIGWKNCEKFCNAMLPYVIEKKRHLEIVSRILELHKISKIEGVGGITNHLGEFDAFRHELHALANKGTSLSKKWLK